MSFNDKFVKNQSLAAGFTSNPQLVFDGALFAIQMVFTGSPCLFSATLEVSNDAVSNGTPAPVNFDPMPDSSVSITEAGSFLYNITPGASSYSWIRLVIADDSGGTNTGTLCATLTVKG